MKIPEQDGWRQNYQRDFAFAAFIFFVCSAAFVYLSKSLADVFIPIVWSGFFAIPMTGLIAGISRGSVECFARFAALIFGHSPITDRVNFTARSSQGSEEAHAIQLENSDTARSICKHLENPCAHFCFSGQLPNCCGLRGSAFGWCQCRVRITKLCREDKTDVKGPMVNRLVVNWVYTARVEGLKLLLFLDCEENYPAVVAGKSGEECEVPDEEGQGGTLIGELELDRTSSISWTFGLIVSLLIMTMLVGIFITFINMGILSLKSSADGYARGVSDLVDSIDHFLPGFSNSTKGPSGLDRLAKDLLPSIASKLASQMGNIGFSVLMFLIYLFFWICEPLPVNDSVAKVIKSFLLLKTIVCLLFAGLMGTLLWSLECPLWHLYVVITFLLNYIPEFGSIAAGLLMIPAVLFDGHLPMAQRQTNTILLVVFGVLFKVITANIIEVQLYATRGGQYMRMHPVIILAMMMMFEALLGLTGMFLAIPIMAAVKYYIVSTDMPASFLNPLLVLVEGDQAAPHKNFVEHRVLASYGATEYQPSSDKDGLRR